MCEQTDVLEFLRESRSGGARKSGLTSHCSALEGKAIAASSPTCISGISLEGKTNGDSFVDVPWNIPGEAGT